MSEVEKEQIQELERTILMIKNIRQGTITDKQNQKRFLMTNMEIAALDYTIEFLEKAKVEIEE